MNAQEATTAKKSSLAVFASVKLTVVLMSAIAATVLLGAWCPQESQVGQEKVVEQFGPDMALTLVQLGVTDIFHTPFFLFLIAMLTVNMVACSVQRVFPKVRLLKQPMPYLSQKEIARLPFNVEAAVESLEALEKRLKKAFFVVSVQGDKLVAEFGKFGRLAPTITHIGLLTLLLGVTITSWTGFSGFKPVALNDSLSFADSEHSKLWIGKLPAWHVRVDATRREDYDSGEAKQWYSTLTVLDQNGKMLKQGEISVNNPLSYEGVDIYQSSWGLDKIVVSFNNDVQKLQLRPMGKLNAAFLPLDKETVLIMSLRSQDAPLRLFAKRPEWEAPKLLSEIPRGSSTHLGPVVFKYENVLPVSGLQYKCDPGLWVTYVAFGFIITGVMLAAVPHRQVWAQFVPSKTAGGTLYVGGRSVKAKIGFERLMAKLIDSIRKHEEDTIDTTINSAEETRVLVGAGREGDRDV